MKKLLIQQAIRKLQHEFDSEASIMLEHHAHLLDELAEVMHSYKLARTRKLNILGCYLLLQIAIARHRELAIDQHAELAKSLLDGDYCFGLYYQYLVQCNELHLLSYLAPIHKKLQIELVEGQSVEHILQTIFTKFKLFLDEHAEKDGVDHESA